MTIVDIMRTAKEARIRLDAAGLLLTRGWGIPKQQIDVMHDSAVRTIIIERLDQLNAIAIEGRQRPVAELPGQGSVD